MIYEIVILDINELREHEAINPVYVKELAEQIKKEGFVRNPIPVDNKHNIILDGHHRYHALKYLKCKKVPVYRLDYFSDEIKLDLWPEARIRGMTKITKQDIIKMALANKKYPPKTSRHIFQVQLPETPVVLSELL